jgi:methylphosphotriester-DNA--protein-cysteine methyltransferase
VDQKKPICFNPCLEAIQNNFRPCRPCKKTVSNQWIYSVPIRRKPKLIAQRRNRILLWPYDANSGCKFYLENLLETI